MFNKYTTANLMCALSCIVFVFCASQARAQTSASGIIKKHMDKMQGEAAAKKEASEKRIEKLSEQQKEALEAYRKLSARLEALQGSKRRLEQAITEQSKVLERQEEQLKQSPELEHKAQNLLQNMTESIEAFINADLPFHKEKRLKDVASLRLIVNSPNTTPADKIKAVFNAYVNELAYGRSIETYDAELKDVRFCKALDNKPAGDLVVTFMRYGRLSLAFISPDGKITAHWNKNGQCWQQVSGTLAIKISEAIGVAEKRSPPGFIVFPVTKEQLSKISGGKSGHVEDK